MIQHLGFTKGMFSAYWRISAFLASWLPEKAYKTSQIWPKKAPPNPWQNTPCFSFEILLDGIYFITLDFITHPTLVSSVRYFFNFNYNNYPWPVGDSSA